jgi:CDP-glucose 4,6-dehydratase
MKLQNANVLVTGGTGFVGSHLVEALVNLGAKVVTTYQREDPHSYFSQHKFENQVICERVDFTHFDDVFNLATKHGITCIFHLGAQPIVETAYYNPRRTLESNITGTINILECARLYSKIEAVIIASSDKAYGKHGKKKYVETDELKGDHPYEVSKSAADLISTMYMKTYGLPIVTSRFGNIYGEGDQNYTRIIPGIMKALIEQSTLKLRSDGTLVRDYLHVKDVVRGYLLLAKDINKVRGNAFNFGGSETLRVLDVITLIEKALSLKVAYSIDNTAKNEIPYQSLDYSKIQNALGWKPKETISKSALAMYNYYKTIL